MQTSGTRSGLLGRDLASKLSLSNSICASSALSTLVQAINRMKRICVSSSFKTIHISSSSIRTPPHRPVSTNNQREWRTVFEENAKRHNVPLSELFQLDINKLDEKVTQIVKKEFKGSMYRAVCKLFPETEWAPQQFGNNQKSASLPSGHWKDISNHRKYFEDLGQKLGVNTLDDWYEKLSRTVMIDNRGGGLLAVFNGSPINALLSAYPEHNWLVWKFNNVSLGFWQSIENQRKFFDWLGKQIGIKELDDWYGKISKKLLEDNGAYCLLKRYNGSPFFALMGAYPEHTWFPWKFSSIPTGYWKDWNNQRKFFDHLANKLQIKEPSDWYQKLDKIVIVNHGGGSLVERVYNGSPIAALMAAYPEHKFVPWEFKMVPHNFWKSKDNVFQYLTELSEKLSIQTLDDWYRVDHILLHKFGAAMLLTRYKGLYQLLKEHYPHHPWDPKRFQQTAKKTQRWLAVTVKKMFPDEDYLHPKIRLSSRRPMQLDVYIPSKSLAFEYQGIQHFREVGVFNPSVTYQRRDEEKRVLCASNNIKLIEVPYWWNRTPESLQEMIK